MGVHDSLLRLHRITNGCFRPIALLGLAALVVLVVTPPAGATSLRPDPSPDPGTVRPKPDPYPSRTPTAASTTPAAPATSSTMSRPAVPSEWTPTAAVASTPVRHPAHTPRRTEAAPPRHAARPALSVQALARLVPDLWPPRIIPPSAAAEIASGEDVPAWAALAVAAVVLTSGLFVLRIGREAAA